MSFARLFSEAAAHYKEFNLAESERLCRGILKFQPNHFDTLVLLSIITAETFRYHESAGFINKALELQPYNVTAIFNSAGLLLQTGQYEEAIKRLNFVISLTENNIDAYTNLGSAYAGLKNFKESIKNYDIAISMDSTNGEANFGKAIYLLREGHFSEGWELYKWRFSRRELHDTKWLVDRIKKPEWTGEQDIKNKKILIIAEQGLGDTIQYIRYTKLLSEMGAKVVVEVQRELIDIVKSLDHISEVVERGIKLPLFDFYCCAGSLPGVFKTDSTNIPLSQGYLKSDSDKIIKWENILGKKTKPRIGLVWSGNKNHKNDYIRSIALTPFLEYLPEEFEFICLQKEIYYRDKSVLENVRHIRCFENEIKDFSDTAALCELMDLVISVDTSVAHLSGALGKPTWVPVPIVPDWRWMLDRTDSPWYDSVTLYRQEVYGDWDAPLERLKKDLLDRKFE